MPKVNITSTATLIVGNNSSRKSLILVNSGSETVFLGPDDSVTTGLSASTMGVPIVPDGTLTEDSGGMRMFMGDIYGISSLGYTSETSYWERT